MDHIEIGSKLMSKKCNILKFRKNVYFINVWFIRTLGNYKFNPQSYQVLFLFDLYFKGSFLIRAHLEKSEPLRF